MQLHTLLLTCRPATPLHSPRTRVVGGSGTVGTVGTTMAPLHPQAFIAAAFGGGHPGVVLGPALVADDRRQAHLRRPQCAAMARQRDKHGQHTTSAKALRSVFWHRWQSYSQLSASIQSVCTGQGRLVGASRPLQGAGGPMVVAFVTPAAPLVVDCQGERGSAGRPGTHLKCARACRRRQPRCRRALRTARLSGIGWTQAEAAAGRTEPARAPLPCPVLAAEKRALRSTAGAARHPGTGVSR